jgi:hypothetical protein
MEAFMAMNPDCLPISFTTLMPPELRASTRALISDRCASSTAVSNPKQRSICRGGRGQAGRQAGRQEGLGG